MDNKYWLEYVKHCYDLVLESEKNSALILEHEIEAYIVHLMARNFNRLDIGENPIAIQLLEYINQKSNKEKLLLAADECLLIHSFPLKKSKWPSKNYYMDMGIIAYGLANHIMEKNFQAASTIMYGIFNRTFENLLVLPNFDLGDNKKIH